MFIKIYNLIRFEEHSIVLYLCAVSNVSIELSFNVTTYIFDSLCFSVAIIILFGCPATENCTFWCLRTRIEYVLFDLRNLPLIDHLSLDRIAICSNKGHLKSGILASLNYYINRESIGLELCSCVAGICQIHD